MTAVTSPLLATILGADADIWRYQPHPEVWILVGCAIGLGLYATRVIGPKAVAPGQEIVSRSNKRAFVAAVVLLWLASDWPMHDISEEYLYFVHMFQHLLITFVIPPLFLMSMPEWLGRLIVSGDGSAGVWIKRLSRPVFAGFVFNFFVAITHLTQVVNTSVANGPFHYAIHLAVFIAAVLMWIPVVGPLPELRISLPGQMLYLFLMSILPTIPAAFLTFAETPLYEAYNHDVRLWGISAAADQQAAGVVMKLGGGMYLWSLIGVLFFRWSLREQRQASPTELTYERVTEAFDRAGPAPAEPV